LEVGLLLKTTDRAVLILAEIKPRPAKYEAGSLNIFFVHWNKLQ
jgi:hypothetical protein